MRWRGAVRLACYGWLERDAGSGAGASYLLVCELLAQGIEIDFFANEDHVRRPGGLNGAFQYFAVNPPHLVRQLPLRADGIAARLLSPLMRRVWRGSFQLAAEAQHRELPYDAVLSLDTPPMFAISGVPTVTWLPSPPDAELDSIRRLRELITNVSGRRFYFALVAYYKYRKVLERGILSSSDMIVCGSEWSRGALVCSGIPEDRVHVNPHVIDLELFSPNGVEADLDEPILLSLGRLDPRKRLDLLLGAFELVLARYPGARLRIVGSPGYAPNQLSLIERFPYRDRVEYRPPVARTAVPALIREAAVLVQTSENEGFGSSVAEALACGVPAAVGPSNGTGEYLDRTSQIFDAYTHEAAAAAICKVLDLRREDPGGVRASTRAAAEHSFCPRSVAERLIALVEAALRRQIPIDEGSRTPADVRLR